MANPKAAPKRDVKPRASEPFTLSTAWVAVLIALLTVLFFHEISLGGRTFVSSDATQPAGFVRIGEQSLWKLHVYPLWNPFVFLGMPSFASGAYNPLIYPPDWPVALVQKALPMLPEMTWMLIYYFLGAFFFYLLAKEWGARSEGALLGAMAFMFAPNLVAVGSHGHGSQLVDSAYLPLMVWLAARWMRRGSLTDLGVLAIAGGFQFLRGHLQVCFYTWVAVVVYAVVEVAAAIRQPSDLLPRLTRAAGLALAAGLAFGIAGFYNLPLKAYSQYSIRGSGDAAGGTGIGYATQWSMAPYELPAMAVPNWVGFGGATYWGAMPFTDYPNAYVGIVVLLLALPAFLLGGRTRAFALLLGAFALMVSFGSHFPLYNFLYDHLPQFNKFRIPVMIILLVQFALALGAAWGWSAVLEPGDDGKRRDAIAKLLLGAGGALLLAGLVVAFGGESLRASYVAAALSHRPQFTPDLANAAFAAFTGDMGRVVVTGLIVVALAWFTVRGKMGASVASVIVLCLLLFDIWPVSTQVMQPAIGERVESSLDVGRDDVVQFLEKAGPWGSFRVFMPDQYQDNRVAGFGIATLGGYHAAKPRLYQDFMDRNAIFDSREFGAPRLWSLLNVRYLVVGQPMPPEQTPPWWKPVFQGSAVVYENLLALPRATVVGAYAVLPDTGLAAIDSIKTSAHDPRTFTWLTKDPGVQLGPVEGATAAITEYGLHTVKVDVNTPGTALLRLSDLWYPDWTVRVDGKKAEMLRADHALRAVVVPAGAHQVEFRFESASIRNGLTLSLVSVVVALAMLVAGALLGRRTRNAETGPEVA